LKRQQAVEDAIALRLASNETGKTMESLPPGKIFGINVTEPLTEPKNEKEVKSLVSIEDVNKSSSDLLQKGSTSTSKSPNISQNAIEMLSSLFPHRKRSVLELVLRRCDLDLLRWVQVLNLNFF
jgi:doublesex- and mab-3-related transcription factor 4/5